MPRPKSVGPTDTALAHPLMIRVRPEQIAAMRAIKADEGIPVVRQIQDAIDQYLASRALKLATTRKRR